MPARTHPLPIRITHWVNAAAMTVMIMSGWRIYNASPLFSFEIPPFLTLGNWLGGALAWHFAAMWVLPVNSAVYLGYGLVSGRFRRRFLPLSPNDVLRDLALALRFRLPHQAGEYNAVQRVLYVLVWVGIIGAIASGLALWKPIQLSFLSALMGGYEASRRIHFAAMSGIFVFVVIHLALVLLVPRTLLPMITGREAARRSGA
jgi:thiosulfate reductase cytochrome b subunit